MAAGKLVRLLHQVPDYVQLCRIARAIGHREDAGRAQVGQRMRLYLAGCQRSVIQLGGQDQVQAGVVGRVQVDEFAPDHEGGCIHCRARVQPRGAAAGAMPLGRALVSGRLCMRCHSCSEIAGGLVWSSCSCGVLLVVRGLEPLRWAKVCMLFFLD